MVIQLNSFFSCHLFLFCHQFITQCIFLLPRNDVGSIRKPFDEITILGARGLCPAHQSFVSFHARLISIPINKMFDVIRTHYNIRLDI